MKKAILGKKLGMTQIFDANGLVIPVTVVEAGPCTVVQVKTKDADGYEAVQLGFGEVKENKIIKPIKGHFTKANVTPKKHLREFRLEEISYNVGDEIKADIFADCSGDSILAPLVGAKWTKGREARWRKPQRSKPFFARERARRGELF